MTTEHTLSTAEEFAINHPTVTLHLTATDFELRVIEAACITLEQIDKDTQDRVLAYLCDRFGTS